MSIKMNRYSIILYYFYFAYKRKPWNGMTSDKPELGQKENDLKKVKTRKRMIYNSGTIN